MRQFFVTVQSRDIVTPLRAIILMVFTLAIITLIPVLAYQTLRASSTTDEGLRSIVTVLSPVNRLATLALLIVFVNYRIKDE